MKEIQEVMQHLESLGRVARSNAALSVTPDAWKEHAARISDLFDKLVTVGRTMDALERQRNDGYMERNTVVALLTAFFPAGIRDTEIEGWDEDWKGCVYIDLPTGQVSFHYHDDEAEKFAHLPPYTKKWDGHDKDEAMRRLLTLATNPDIARRAVPRG